jgi:hypothetical protein
VDRRSLAPGCWARDCWPRAGDRSKVFGAGFDNETGRQIIEPGSWLYDCNAPLLAFLASPRR